MWREIHVFHREPPQADERQSDAAACKSGMEAAVAVAPEVSPRCESGPVKTLMCSLGG